MTRHLHATALDLERMLFGGKRRAPRKGIAVLVRCHPAKGRSWANAWKLLRFEPTTANSQ